MSEVALRDIAGHLDDYLRIREIPDAPNAVNGLQVENGGTVTRIVAAVDASLATIEAATAGDGRTLVLVHHGLFWDGNVPATGRRYRRLRALIAADAALYSAHIPLDVHPDVGNNMVLAERLGLVVDGWFGDYRGVALGVRGHAPPPLSQRSLLLREIERALGVEAEAIHLVPGGPDRPGRIGIVTGAGGSMIAEARDAGLDTLITGEGPHHTYFDAMEWGLNVIYAGHYATETLGVQALASHLADRFDLPWEFHDHPTGL
ncbi:MAG TPA: Nif3-like dinuclear metal center hexameric protein [Gemmatimonadales bacterium]|nr:Nif3-like dinuclear metal center hexameric protein [Gemmatimonadales bacterium]